MGRWRSRSPAAAIAVRCATRSPRLSSVRATATASVASGEVARPPRRSAHPAPGAFRIVAGEERLRVWKPEDGGEKWFCGDCGSALFGRNPTHPDPIGIRMGTFDRRPRRSAVGAPVRRRTPHRGSRFPTTGCRGSRRAAMRPARCRGRESRRISGDRARAGARPEQAPARDERPLLMRDEVARAGDDLLGTATRDRKRHLPSLAPEHPRPRADLVH